MSNTNVTPRYSLLKGTFYIFFEEDPKGGPEPDGDTVRFVPDDPFRVLTLRKFGFRCPDISRRGINVRFEGIDSLETHYSVQLKGKPQITTHQALKFALEARDFLLDRLGFRGIQYWPVEDIRYKVSSVSNHPRRGFVLANGIDGNGRLLDFVYPEDSSLQNREDGKAVFLNPELLRQSLNMALVEAGLAYAELYTSLPADLVSYFVQAIDTERKADKGIWHDEHVSTTRATEIDGLAKLKTLVLWPKLFRRLAVFFVEGHTSLNDFDAWLREDPIHRDDRLILPNREFGNIHDLVVIEGDTLRLRHEPENVIILPDNA